VCCGCVLWLCVVVVCVGFRVEGEPLQGTHQHDKDHTIKGHIAPVVEGVWG
jgi:hypothetical protein